MFSSLLRPRQALHHVRLDDREHSASPGPASRRYAEQRHATADFTEADDDDDESIDGGQHRYGNDGALDDEDGPRESLPMLPLFSSAYLDTLPVYNITHAIRIVVQTRTETALSWDQLRSPQVSQFLVKPMQQQIRAQHFSRATLYALLANCLQFAKEVQLYPGNAATSSTRAEVCELLAMKLLKEYNTRELIDALSYDFHPLQGLPEPAKNVNPGKAGSKLAGARTSTLEVAIRASAKKFLAHPLVTRHLEAIWNGAISFYSSADSLHRQAPSTQGSGAGRNLGKAGIRTPLLTGQGAGNPASERMLGRRTVTLYDPRQASLFKLSRLRVPRYRSFLSTLSLAVLIGLLLSVLIRRSVQITGLELVFWFWSAGFMLDELVDFNEQGLSLYIMSFWNIFDLGILVMLIIYYCMRSTGVFLAEPHHWNDVAYEILAANAILLLPRVFSVLGHYPYFSQLLVAFRLMAVDLVAVFLLVLISCGAFFVFFCLSRSQHDAPEVAYRIFQILMGYSSAAWDVWPTYNWLAKSIMAMFLVICHFVVITILITVLANSFLTVSSNASEEQQFLFAINTISMVKNDSLFSYIPPGNIFAWMLMPIRYCLPLKQFVWLNRQVIKATHFPLLFCIFFYERYWLASYIYEPTDLVENPGRGQGRPVSFIDPASRTAILSPNVRVREEPGVGFQKDRALAEIFRRTPDIGILKSQRRSERRKTQTAIRTWMDEHDDLNTVSKDWSAVEQARPANWQRRFSMTRELPSKLRQVSDVRSAASDPADLVSNSGMGQFAHLDASFRPVRVEYRDHTDADGDDELVTNDEEEEDNATIAEASRLHPKPQAEDYFTTPSASRFPNLPSPLVESVATTPKAGQSRRGVHNRALSTNTILYNPEERQARSPQSTSPEMSQSRSRPLSGRGVGIATPASGKQSPGRLLYMATSRSRPSFPRRDMTPTAPSRAALTDPEQRSRKSPAGHLSSSALNRMWEPNSELMGASDPAGRTPSSLPTHMAMAKEAHLVEVGRATDGVDRDRIEKLILARMKTLEEGFTDMLQEMRQLRASTTLASKRTASADELRLAGMTMIEVAGKTRPRKTKGEGQLQKRVSIRRPGSRRSLKETRFAPSRDKGKGKEIVHSSGDEDVGLGEESFSKKGSSF